MGNYRNNPWFASTHSTAAGIVLEQRDSTIDAAAQGYVARKYRLRGVSISGTTAIAISTLAIKVIYGRSSVDATTQEFISDPGITQRLITDIMGIEGEYIGIESTAAHPDGGLSIAIWGD